MDKLFAYPLMCLAVGYWVCLSSHCHRVCLGHKMVSEYSHWHGTAKQGLWTHTSLQPSRVVYHKDLDCSSNIATADRTGRSSFVRLWMSLLAPVQCLITVSISEVLKVNWTKVSCHCKHLRKCVLKGIANEMNK